MIRDWSRETLLVNHTMAVFLITENLNDLHGLLVKNNGAFQAKIPLPGKAELENALRAFLNVYPIALERFKENSAELAGQLSGTALSAIESLLKKKEYEKEFGVAKGGRKRLSIYVAMVLAGMILLALGSRWLVLGAVALAELFGLSEPIIGLTVIAIGTSLPELVTSMVASLRNERDIAIGNIIGSNVMNLAFVLGIGALIAKGGLGVALSALHFDFPVMIATALACLPIFYTGQRIARWEGALFLFYYIAYVSYLTLNATEHDAAPAFGVVMMAFVIPITVVTLGILTIRTVRARRVASSS